MRSAICGSTVVPFLARPAAKSTDRGQRGPIRPDIHAQLASSTRLRAASFDWMLAMCVFTVLSEMNSSAPISAFVRPRATARRTSSSRSVSGAAGWAAVPAGGEALEQAHRDRR